MSASSRLFIIQAGSGIIAGIFVVGLATEVGLVSNGPYDFWSWALYAAAFLVVYVVAGRVVQWAGRRKGKQ